MRRRAYHLVVCIVAWIAIAGGSSDRVAYAQMPDLSQMSGKPLPSGGDPDGTISVRVIRDTITNNLTNQPVTLNVGGSRVTVNTDEGGRARFTDLTPGARVRASTTVDGQVIDSEAFEVPAKGGVRVMLVARSGKAAGADGVAPAPQGSTAESRPGVVVLSPESRFVIEQADESLRVYGLLEIRNSEQFPVTTEPLVFELPAGAQGAATLEGSSPQARIEGTRVRVTGPFPPGSTPVQFAYVMPYTGGSVTFEQKLPAAWEQVSLIAEQTGQIRLESPQIATHREAAAGGKSFIVAEGPKIATGGTLRVELSGLPHRPTWPRDVALGLASAILLAGAWVVVRSRTHDVATARARLEARREELLDELARLEERRRAQGLDPRASRRAGEIVSQLERLYGRLDGVVTAEGAEEAAAPRVTRTA